MPREPLPPSPRHPSSDGHWRYAAADRLTGRAETVGRRTVARQREGVTWQPMAGGGVVYQWEKGRICILNEAGTLVWSLCDGYHTVDDMARVLAAQFALDEVTARGDVRTCLDLLWRAEVVALEAGQARH